MDLPTEFAKWAYGRWFVGHPIVGFIIVASILSMFVSGVFALFWLRGVDKYNETQPMPISKNETQPKPIPKNGKAIDGRHARSIRPSHMRRFFQRAHRNWRRLSLRKYLPPKE